MNAELAVIAAATERGGIVTRDLARRLGMTDRQVTYRISERIWEPVVAGAFRLVPASSPLDEALGAAAVLPNAVLSHFTAAYIHGLRFVPTDRPSVTVHAQTTHSFPGVGVTRCFDLATDHIQPFRWTSVTTPERTVMDLAARRLSDRQFDAMADDAIASGKASIGTLSEVLEAVARRGKPGVARVRRFLGDRLGDDLGGSVLERRANQLLSDAGLKGFVSEFATPWNRSQRFDVAFPAAKLAIEWDSRRWHTTVDAFERDRRRDRATVVHGWRILRFTWRDVMSSPHEVIATVTAALEDRDRSVG